MDSEKGNRVFARGHNVPPPPLVFGAQKKPGLDRVKRRPPFSAGRPTWVEINKRRGAK